MILTYHILSMEHLSIKYDNFIRNNLGILLEDIQLNICRVMWYKHDGCPAHCGRRVTATQWNLSKSMDRTRADVVARSYTWHNTAQLFLRETLKNIVYQEVPIIILMLKRTIRCVVQKCSFTLASVFPAVILLC